MTGNKLIDIIIIALSFLVTAGVAGFFYVSTTKMFARPEIDSEKESEALNREAQGVTIPEAYRLKKITVNLRSRTKRLRFLDVTIQLVPFKPDYNSYLEPRKHILRDTVIRIAGGMYPNDLSTISGKILFENKLRKTINEILGIQMIKEIYFTHFVVQ